MSEIYSILAKLQRETGDEEAHVKVCAHTFTYRDTFIIYIIFTLFLNTTNVAFSIVDNRIVLRRNWKPNIRAAIVCWWT